MTKFARRATCLLCFLALLWHPHSDPAGLVQAAENNQRSNELNQKVLNFVRANLGRQVGNGQCAELAQEALEAVGGKTPYDYDQSGDYIWGTFVADPRDAQPGDIIQFKDAKFHSVENKNGRTFETSQTVTKHTSIISKNLGNGTFLLLDQNIDGRTTVGERKLDLSTQTQGSLKIFRPEKSGPAL